MSTALPKRTRVYKNHHLDSTRWDHVPLRDDDVVISTSLKTGTTWTQRILSLLVLRPGPAAVELELRLAVDRRGVLGAGRDRPRPGSRRRTHRRFFKCHLPLDALPYDEKRQVHLRRPRRSRRVHVALEPLRRLQRRDLRTAQRSREARRRAARAVPGRHPHALRRMGEPRLVPLGARRLPVLVALLSRAELLEFPASPEHPLRSLQRSQGGPRKRDAPHRQRSSTSRCRRRAGRRSSKARPSKR